MIACGTEATKPKILVVDDQVHIVKFIQATLEREGYRVVTATSGEEALERVRAGEPDLVLCDSSMPGMSGLDVLRSLKTEEQTRNLPFIMLTDNAAGADMRDGFWIWRPVVDTFVTKPFSPKEVVAFVERALNDPNWGQCDEDTLNRLHTALDTASGLPPEAHNGFMSRLFQRFRLGRASRDL